MRSRARHMARRAQTIRRSHTAMHIGGGGRGKCSSWIVAYALRALCESRFAWRQVGFSGAFTSAASHGWVMSFSPCRQAFHILPGHQSAPRRQTDVRVSAPRSRTFTIALPNLSGERIDIVTHRRIRVVACTRHACGRVSPHAHHTFHVMI